MAPLNHPYYAKDEKVLCFHHELLYEAKIIDYKPIDQNDKKSPYQYRVHYKGWKNTWDDWVPQDRIRKNTEENKELAANLKLEMDKTLRPAKAAAAANKKKAVGSDLSSTRGSEERLTPIVGRGQKRGRDLEIEKVRECSPNKDILPPSKRTRRTEKGRADSSPQRIATLPKRRFRIVKRTRDVDAGVSLEPLPNDLTPLTHRRLMQIKAARLENRNPNIIINLEQKANSRPTNPQEETFNQRPAIHLPVPDNLKSLLVDDWEYVTKNLSLIPLPAEHPVNEIIDTYYAEEKKKRRIGSAEADILQEVQAGLKEYFERTLGKILLYRFERQQYLEARKAMAAGEGEWEGKAIGDVYGAEHLARLIVSLPELIAQTNMDEQSVRKLRDEMVKLTAWLGKNSARFFTAEYEPQSQDYVEKARGG